MTTTDPQPEPVNLTPDPAAIYDLIICHNDQIVFHDHYADQELRLRLCVGLLTNSDIVRGVVDSPRAAQIRDLYQGHWSQWHTAPDSVADLIAALCRPWGVQIYLSTTKKTSAAPTTLFSVITAYGPGQTTAEHFTTREDRRASLVESVERLFERPGCIPGPMLANEQHLAALLAALLTSSTVTLTESVLDETDGVYKPSGPLLPIR